MPKRARKTKAYRKADQRIADAITGLYTAEPPDGLPALDSDRVTIVARLVRDRDEVLENERTGQPVTDPPPLPSKQAPPRLRRPARNQNAIKAIDALDDADRPRPDWEEEQPVVSDKSGSGE